MPENKEQLIALGSIQSFVAGYDWSEKFGPVITMMNNSTGQSAYECALHFPNEDGSFTLPTKADCTFSKEQDAYPTMDVGGDCTKVEKPHL